MNNCDKISELINAYADGEATEKEKELVEAHIKECVSCKQKLDFILKTKDILKATPKMPVPETLLKDFEEYRKKEEESAKKVIPFYKNYRMYASVAAIFIFAFVLKTFRGFSASSLLSHGNTSPGSRKYSKISQIPSPV